jgi:hypothetical protein
MKPKEPSFFDNSDSKVAAYESLLDLFTLISFVLIFAAVIYVTRNSTPYESSSLIDSKVANHGSGIAQLPPQRGFLITIYREGSNDKLSIKNLGSGETAYEDVSQGKVDTALGGFLAEFEEVNETNVAISGDKDSTNAQLLFAVQLWLTKHNLKYHLYFSPTNE